MGAGQSRGWGRWGSHEYLLEIFTLPILLGVTLGLTQALVVRRYLPTGSALLWALFSSFGWFFGWLFF